MVTEKQIEQVIKEHLGEGINTHVGYMLNLFGWLEKPPPGMALWLACSEDEE